MRTRVAIIGAGPSGLLLAQLLHRRGIEAVVLERKTREYVLGRIRAGVLERGTCDLLAEAGVGDRLQREGYRHDGIVLAYGEERLHINFPDHVDKPVVIYGQTELTRDLFDAREACGGAIEYNVSDVELHDLDGDSPSVSYSVPERGRQTLHCDFVAGCDGFHGVSRQSIPLDVRVEYEQLYPFGWLGVLSETPPVHEELVYAHSSRGFALCSMRNSCLSRYYIQCSLSDHPRDWSDTLFWDELRRRLSEEEAARLVTGPSIEKSIAPLRSFVIEPMQWGRLFLCGDAAHIVPPTGAKGLNTAASDVHYLYHAMWQYYEDNDSNGIERYSGKALARVWKAERFSWWMTNLLHRFPDRSEFEVKMQRAEFDFLRDHDSAQASLAINYVGLPY